MRIGGISATNSDRAGDEPIREEDGSLSVDVAEKMLKWHAEAIGRCIELSSPNDVCVLRLVLADLHANTYFSAKNTFALLRALTEALADAYVVTAIET